jgi:hypothetical protein
MCDSRATLDSPSDSGAIVKDMQHDQQDLSTILPVTASKEKFRDKKYSIRVLLATTAGCCNVQINLGSCLFSGFSSVVRI